MKLSFSSHPPTHPLPTKWNSKPFRTHPQNERITFAYFVFILDPSLTNSDQDGFGLPGLWNFRQTCRTLSLGEERCSKVVWICSISKFCRDWLKVEPWILFSNFCKDWFNLEFIQGPSHSTFRPSSSGASLSHSAGETSMCWDLGTGYTTTCDNCWIQSQRKVILHSVKSSCRS